MVSKKKKVKSSSSTLVTIPARRGVAAHLKKGQTIKAVSYTHLTLPTICSV